MEGGNRLNLEVDSGAVVDNEIHSLGTTIDDQSLLTSNSSYHCLAVNESPVRTVENGTPFSDRAHVQIDLAEEYLEFCKLYPPRHLKTIRSHLMKFLFKYFEVHVEQRNTLGIVNSMEGFEAVCIDLRAVAGPVTDYPLTWYCRHMFPTKHSSPSKARDSFELNADKEGLDEDCGYFCWMQNMDEDEEVGLGEEGSIAD